MTPQPRPAPRFRSIIIIPDIFDVVLRKLLVLSKRLLPLDEASLKHINLLPLVLSISINANLPRFLQLLSLPQILKRRFRASLLAQSAVENDNIFVFERPDELGHSEVVRVYWDMLTSDDMAADVVVISDVDDGEA